MKLSRKSDYALRAVIHLANLPTGKLGSINSISEAELVPREFLAKILKDLTRGGVLVSYQGVTGGYRLARAPREITFLNVLEAIDGPVHLNLCTEGRGANCSAYGRCPMCGFWDDQERMFKKSLSKQHLAKYKKKAHK